MLARQIKLQNTLLTYHWHITKATYKRWDAALPRTIIPVSNSLTITSEKHCVTTTWRNWNMDVWDALIQGWNVESFSILAASNSLTITSKKHCAKSTCRNVCVWYSLVQFWNLALSIVIIPTSNCLAVTSKKHTMTSTCRHLDVCYSLFQGWNLALSIKVVSRSDCLTIASEK